MIDLARFSLISLCLGICSISAPLAYISWSLPCRQSLNPAFSSFFISSLCFILCPPHNYIIHINAYCVNNFIHINTQDFSLGVSTHSPLCFPDDNRHTKDIFIDSGKDLTVHFTHQCFANIKSQTASFHIGTVASAVKGVEKIWKLLFFQAAS